MVGGRGGWPCGAVGGRAERVWYIDTTKRIPSADRLSLIIMFEKTNQARPTLFFYLFIGVYLLMHMISSVRTPGLHLNASTSKHQDFQKDPKELNSRKRNKNKINREKLFQQGPLKQASFPNLIIIFNHLKLTPTSAPNRGDTHTHLLILQWAPPPHSPRWWRALIYIASALSCRFLYFTVAAQLDTLSERVHAPPARHPLES